MLVKQDLSDYFVTYLGMDSQDDVLHQLLRNGGEADHLVPCILAFFREEHNAAGFLLVSFFFFSSYQGLPFIILIFNR